MIFLMMSLNSKSRKIEQSASDAHSKALAEKDLVIPVKMNEREHETAGYRGVHQKSPSVTLEI